VVVFGFDAVKFWDVQFSLFLMPILAFLDLYGYFG